MSSDVGSGRPSLRPSHTGNNSRRIVERRWVNPYVHKLESVAPALVGTDRKELSDGELAQLRERLARESRVFIEFGSGSGGHLVEQARRDPHSLWIGVELRFKRAVRTAEKAIKAGLTNLIVVRTDALTLQESLPANSFDGIFVNFPDPWDKKRWKKHRLLGEESLKGVSRLLKAEGMLSFKTDHRGYFEDVLCAVHSGDMFHIERVSLNLHQSEFRLENVRTEFEELFVKKELPIFFLKAISKRPA